MSTNKTSSLGLHSWVKSDPFRMDEFNENFDAIDKAVAGTAEQTALESETAAWESALAALSGRVDKKAEQTALDAEIVARKSAVDAEAAARKSALDALTKQVSALDAGRLRFKYDSYVGNGTSGTAASTANRLTFDFKPLLLIISYPGSASYGGIPWIRGDAAGVTTLASGSIHYASLTWEAKAVKWTNYYATQTASQRLNENGITYNYLAIGVLE